MIGRLLAAALAAASLAFAGLAAAAAERTSARAIEAHTRFLADDLLEGRDAGTRGFDIASAYVAAQFAAVGLSPGGPGGGWYQPLTVRRRTLEHTAIAYWRDGGDQVLVNGRDVALDASPYATDESLDLELVFVGWGIDAPRLGQDDYAGLDVRGKAVVLLEGAPERLPPAVRAHFSWIQQKERMAAARGAVAVLTLKSPARERFSQALGRTGLRLAKQDVEVLAGPPEQAACEVGTQRHGRPWRQGLAGPALSTTSASAPRSAATASTTERWTMRAGLRC